MTIQPAEMVVFGEALTDMVRQPDQSWRAHAGGACWNVARVGARLGAHCGFGGAFSNDLFGDELHALSVAAGLDLRYLQRVDKSPLLAMVHKIDPPDYFFVGDDSADLHFDPALLPADWLTQAKILHFGCLGMAREPLASRLLELARQGAAADKIISFDPNWRLPMQQPHYWPVFQAMCRISTQIKVSDEDLLRLFPHSTDSLAALRSMAPQATILYTAGAHGMRWISGETVLVQPAFAVEVQDTIGCGDAAAGGWLVSQLKQPDAPAAHHLAHSAATAACCAAQAGAYAPSDAEVRIMLGR